MKEVDIITITRNDGPLLAKAIESVDRQTARHRLSHIIVDSNEPALINTNDSERTYYHIPPNGVYNALNHGISHSTSEIIGMLHGNDTYANPDVVKTALDVFRHDQSIDFLFANLSYHKPGDTRIIRRYDCEGFEPKMLLSGYGPAHPTLFARRRVFDKVGLYDESFRIAGDFEFWLRLFDSANQFKWKHIPQDFVLMTAGGLSSRLSNQLTTNIFEKRRALKMHGIEPSFLKFLLRLKHL